MSQTMPWCRWLAVFAATLTLASIGLSASAKLTLTTTDRVPFMLSASRCSNGSVAVSVVGTTATVSGINISACGGKTMRLFVHGDSASVNMSATVSDATMTLTLPNTVTVDGAQVTIDDWLIPTTWTQSAPTRSR